MMPPNKESTNQFRLKPCAAAIASVLTIGAVPASYADLEEIVVTATRRAQSVIDVPYNISAVSGSQLDSLNVTDFSKLTRVVPGLQMTDRGVRDNTTSARIIMRGLNTESSTVADVPFVTVSPVATYIDETPVFVNLRMADIQQVEVLRGPQGTLYGSGSLGGTIRFMHNKPNPESFEAQINAGVGFTEDADGENYTFDGMVNIPLGETSALRISGGYDSYAGFIDAKQLAVLDSNGVAVDDPANPGFPLLTTKDDINDADVQFVRAALLMEPTDSLSLQLSYHYQKDEADARDAQSVDYPGIDERETSVLLPEPSERELSLVSLDIEYDFGFAALTSSTSYFETDSDQTMDGTGFYESVGYLATPRVTAPLQFLIEKEIFVQEFRLVSQSEGSIDWIVGAYYMDDSSTDLDEFDWLKGDQLLGGGTLTDENDLFLNLNRQSEFEDMALFGELTYHFSDEWQATVGARAFSQEYTSESFFDFPAFGSYPGDVNKFEEDDVLFKVNTSFDVTDNMTTYFTFAQGFRRGGANSIPTEGPFAEPAELVTYDSDSANNYEVGLKGTIADKYQFSTAVFYIDWKDAQVGILTPVFGYDAGVNAGDVESYGFEGEIFGEFTDNLSFTLGYAYTSSELAEGFSNFATGEKGASLPGVSEHTASGSLDYTQFLGGDYQIIYHIDASYRSEFVNSVDTTSTAFREFDGFAIAGASITLYADSWDVGVYAENIFDEEGLSAQNDPAAEGNAHYFEWVTRPRTLSIRFSKNF